ncbi:glycosyltransferase [Levilactobacillus enshiensis]|uniref:glycosyltransferase n=1 Tax=Levilactobacillus enshiensis TaxID=2590213 RepID=UPI00117BC5C2|nr:glycosyltransferase [Levilactobacillus enshiensis]
MIILHFAEYASGGVATYLKGLIVAQNNSSDVDKIYLYVSEKNTDVELLHLKLNKLIVVPYKYSRSLVGLWKLLSLSKEVKKLHPDVIHIHSSFAGIIRVNFLFSRFKKNVVYCAHGWAFNRDISSAKKIFFKLIEKFLSYGCNKIINISRFERETARFIPSYKMITIYNSLPKKKIDRTSNKVSNKARSGMELLFIGRLDRQKGIDLLVESIKKINDDGFFDLKIIGDSVVNPIITKENSKNIHFLGWKNECSVTKALVNADALVIPSRWEGFGLVALEAMRADCLVIASDAGALPEIVVDGKTGVIFKSQSVNSLESTLLKVKEMSSSEQVSLEKAAAMRFKSVFDYSKMFKQVMNVYQGLN